MSRPKINRWVLLILVGLVAVDVLILVTDLLREGGLDLLTSGSAVAVLGLCSAVWFGLSWGRWLLLGFIALRAVLLGKVVVSSFTPGEVFRLGALAVLLFYIGTVVVLLNGTKERTAR